MSVSSSDAEDEQTQWEGWEDDEPDGGPVQSLFEDATFPTVEAAIVHDAKKHCFDIRQFCALVFFTLFA